MTVVHVQLYNINVWGCAEIFPSGEWLHDHFYDVDWRSKLTYTPCCLPFTDVMVCFIFALTGEPPNTLKTCPNQNELRFL